MILVEGVSLELVCPVQVGIGSRKKQQQTNISQELNSSESGLLIA